MEGGGTQWLSAVRYTTGWASQLCQLPAVCPLECHPMSPCPTFPIWGQGLNRYPPHRAEGESEGNTGKRQNSGRELGRVPGTEYLCVYWVLVCAVQYCYLHLHLILEVSQLPKGRDLIFSRSPALAGPSPAWVLFGSVFLPLSEPAGALRLRPQRGG